jgi:hypothetical protein
MWRGILSGKSWRSSGAFYFLLLMKPRHSFLPTIEAAVILVLLFALQGR